MGKGEATRERIVAEAAPIFNRKGFAGASMQDVMEATGLEKGGLYRHFGSKEELAAEAFRYTLAAAVKTRTDRMDATHTAVEHLRAMIARFVTARSAVPGGCPLMNTAVEADDGNPVLRELARQGIVDWRKRLAAVVREGIRAGEIRREVKPRMVANTIIATLEGALMISRLEGTRGALEDAESSLGALLDAWMA